MKNKVLSVFLAVVMLFCMLPTAPFAASRTWDGESAVQPEQIDGVYQIGSGAELAWFAWHVNACGDADVGAVQADAVLTDDIDLGGHPWTPIGKTAYIVNAYAGTFDGQYHAIDGLRIDAAAASYGLFAQVYGGTVKNVSVCGNVQSNNSVGGIVGKLQNGTVENCMMRGMVTTIGKSTKGYVGGIVGMINGSGSVIRGCVNHADVSGVYSGGILGYNSGSSTVECCYNTGNIIGTTRSAGIAGQLQKGAISRCYNIGESDCGVCAFSNAAITDCYYLHEEKKTPGGSAVGSVQMNENFDLLAALNADGAAFAPDRNAENGGYPILSWQIKAAVAVPVCSVVITGDAQTGSTLTATAFGAQGATPTEAVFAWSVSDDGTTFAPLENEIGAVFTIPDAADAVGKYYRVAVSGAENSAAEAVIGPIVKSVALIERENAGKAAAAAEAFIWNITDVKEAANIPLPKKADGCEIRWHSSHEQLIAADGTVQLPADGIVTVMLSADFICGNAVATKTYPVDVWAENVSPTGYLEKVLERMQWDFSSLQPVRGKDTNILVKFSQTLAQKGLDGVTVTLQSTSDATLIAENGKIHYPQIPAFGSFADGKQVKVVFNLTVGDVTVCYPESDIYALLVPWDTSAVAYNLENALQAALAEEMICAHGDSFTAVTQNLMLPSCLRGEDKYNFAWITWSVSDDRYLAISNEKRTESADALYRPYVGCVHRDDMPHTLTLTAVATNPTTGIRVEAAFDVTVTPLSAQELETTRERMLTVLSCYTAEKLTDSATDDPIDPLAVENDIQLVIPRKVLTADELAALQYGRYWDYWNYRFTVESSDADVIEINSFRASVYRPLGEDSSADKTVTLTVTMISKENPLLSVSKEIPVVVRHLSAAELLDAMSLMDAAVANYAVGLLGNNADAYSVIDDLTPYFGINRDETNTGVTFAYRRSELTGRGIAVDTLPGWESQEDWRLFRSGNRDLIANETLRLCGTPDADTFVKISSVLTDETFGKYYEKFKDNAEYSREALAKFAQLYRQPVSAYVMVPGCGSYTPEFVAMSYAAKVSAYSADLSAYKEAVESPITVTFTLRGLDGEIWIDKTEITDFVDGDTVFDVFKQQLNAHGIAYTAKGSYITGINGLSAMDHGNRSGWMYTVGDVFVTSYMNAQPLRGGEDIVVMYVRDYFNVDTGFDNPTPSEESFWARFVKWIRAVFKKIKELFSLISR